jgi:TPR repeat protein
LADDRTDIVARDLERAFRWLCRSAEYGNPKARDLLQYHHRRGQSPPRLVRDIGPTKAFELLERVSPSLLFLHRDSFLT